MVCWLLLPSFFFSVWRFFVWRDSRLCRQAPRLPRLLLLHRGHRVPNGRDRGRCSALWMRLSDQGASNCNNHRLVRNKCPRLVVGWSVGVRSNSWPHDWFPFFCTNSLDNLFQQECITLPSFSFFKRRGGLANVQICRHLSFNPVFLSFWLKKGVWILSQQSSNTDKLVRWEKLWLQTLQLPSNFFPPSRVKFKATPSNVYFFFPARSFFSFPFPRLQILSLPKSLPFRMTTLMLPSVTSPDPTLSTSSSASVSHGPWPLSTGGARDQPSKSIPEGKAAGFFLFFFFLEQLFQPVFTFFPLFFFSLGFSVTLFVSEALLAIVILLLRRNPAVGGELGGPKSVKTVTTSIFVCLWLNYVMLSALVAYEVINPGM